MGAVIITTAIIFGLDFSNLANLTVHIVEVGVGLLFILFAIQGITARFQPKAFSPTETFRAKIQNHAIRMKPKNVYNLYLRGEGRRSSALYGNILGVGFTPNFTSKIVRDNEGNILYLKDVRGRLIVDEQGKPIARRDVIRSSDGDTIFVVKQGWLSRPEIVRCNRKYHSELIGDVYIYDLCLSPMGDYLYPSKQWQDEIIEIQRQNEAETVITTFMNNLDLISNVTTISIASSPEFQKILSLRNEIIGTPMQPGGMGMPR